MYYSSGNYEAFARPLKPEGVEHKSAYLIGTGLAALTAACYLVRDGQMPGENIHISERRPYRRRRPATAGSTRGWAIVMRGGREMDNHFEVMWDLFRSIPSIEIRGRQCSGRILLAEQAATPTTPSAEPRSIGARTPTPTASST
ncbi:MAG: oleate hydratase [Flavonifractor plautii]